MDDEQIEAAIARTCFVQHMTPREDLAPRSVSYEFRVKKQSAFCKITPAIRKQSCNALFSAKEGGYNIVHCLCDVLLKVPYDARVHLVYNTVLTGGASCFPGFEERFLEEWRAAMKLEKYSTLKRLSKKNPPSLFSHHIACLTRAHRTPKPFKTVTLRFPSEYSNVRRGLNLRGFNISL